MEILHALLNGTAPLLMHNPQGTMASSGDELSVKTIPLAEQEAAQGIYYLMAISMCRLLQLEKR